MTLTLKLTKELEQRLAIEAASLGLPIERYALQLLGAPAPVQHPPTTGAEVVAFWRHESVIGSRPDILDSQPHARALRSHAERRMAD